jgi:tRNA-specific 2-thiouridylase
MAQHVFVGMSGGVDSSLSAALLLEQGYQVTGVYMKNWSKDLPGFSCPWKEDYQDAKRVAVQLGIPCLLYDFESHYRDRVVNYLVEGYRAGITPNPDIMCNQEIKFKLFLETALENGADLIATGHYARIAADGSLLTGRDPQKDQSYFLYRVEQQALARSLMPIGALHKTDVRRQAAMRNLYTADKKDSQGICFVGKVGIKEFLLAELGPQQPGPIIDQAGITIGQHDGALFYTIGQRHGLDVGGGLPYYVVDKNMDTNEVYVSTKLDDARLWLTDISLGALHWITRAPKSGEPLQVRTRYRAPLVACQLSSQAGSVSLQLDEAVRAVTPGQSAVIYSGEHCLGGGIVQ